MRTFLALLLCLSPFVLGVALHLGWRKLNGPPDTSGDAQIVCPHCHVTGQVSTRRVRRKKGVSGGKATGAVFTGGLSLLATGLSRKETQTSARCGNCGSVWEF